MRILLINPTTHNDYYRNEGIKSPPNGLLYLAAYGRQFGYDFRILDRNVDKAEVKAVLKEYKPQVVGLSVITGPCLLDAIEVSSQVRSQMPEATLIWGGVHPTLLYEQVLKDGLCDIAVLGEGEQTLVELLGLLQKGQSVANVPGVATLCGDRVIKTCSREALPDLDKLPDPAWDLVPMHKYLFLSLSTSRGCPFRCTFCYNQHVSGRRRKQMSAERVIELMKRLHTEYGAVYINFLEDNFMAAWGRVGEFCELMEKNQLAVTWDCEGRLTGMRRERLEAMKRGNCYRIRFGVESGSQRILDFIKKDIKLKQIHQVLRDCRDINLRTSVYIINGIPTETKADRDASIQVLYDARPDSVEMTTFRPYPGTELFDYCVARGLFKAPQTTADWAGLCDQYDPHYDVAGAGWQELAGYHVKMQLYLVWLAKRLGVQAGPFSLNRLDYALSSLPHWAEYYCIKTRIPEDLTATLKNAFTRGGEFGMRLARAIERRLPGRRHNLAAKREATGKQSSTSRRPIRILNLESARACNLRCVQCATHAVGTTACDNGHALRKGIMSLETFRKILPILDRVAVLNLDNHGEPLLNKNLEQFIALAKEASPGICVTMTSNFSLMTQDRARSLLMAGLDEIQVSVNGITAQTHEAIMQGSADFETLQKNLACFARVRKEIPNTLSAFSCCITTMRSNIDELMRLPAFLAPFGIDKLRINTCLPFAEHMRKESLYDAPGWHYVGGVISEVVQEAQRLGIHVSHVKTRSNGQTCDFPVKGLAISHDGEVSPCWMLDIRGGYKFFRQEKSFDLPFVSFGNVGQRNLTDIWGSTDFKSYRNRFRNGCPPEYCTQCPVGKGLICG